MGPAELGRLLEGIGGHRDARLLVGYETSDDAAVFEIAPGLLVVQTLDFFTPVVDDPRTFGRIAAANALSDVYAMGAVPLSALNIVCFPRGLDPEILGKILAGGAEKAAEARVAIAGGHTVDDPEPKYGLSVIGTVSREALLTNRTAREGDVLVLTKPLGIGVLTTAFKRGDIGEAELGPAVEVMEQLNAEASRLMTRHGAHACTDVTGFGMLGHLWEMASASGLGAEVRAEAVPVLPEALPFCAAGRLPGGSFANQDHLKDAVRAAHGVEAARLNALFDAQTSGGLLVALDADRAEAFVAELRAEHPWAAVVGRFTRTGGIRVLP
ncbi:MAG: selenide, water dikinase SelD [Acidobacteria bacterium]|nr:selenide, water dikinase SelD [Acidobacteriota bacterium]